MFYKGYDVDKLHETDKNMMGLSNVDQVRILADTQSIPTDVLVAELRDRFWSAGCRFKFEVSS